MPNMLYNSRHPLINNTVFLISSLELESCWYVFFNIKKYYKCPFSYIGLHLRCGAGNIDSIIFQPWKGRLLFFYRSLVFLQCNEKIRISFVRINTCVKAFIKDVSKIVDFVTMLLFV